MMDEPTKGDLVATLAHGVEIRKVAEDNAAWLDAHLREQDALEKAALDGLVDDEPHCLDTLAVWSPVGLIGIWRSVLYPGDTLFSARRFWGWLTSHHADKDWRRFVRMSKPVFNFFWSREEAHVEVARQLTIASYTRCRHWHTRILGGREVGFLMINDVEHVVTELRRG